MNRLLAALCLLAASAVHAQGLPAFSGVSFRNIKSTRFELESPRPRAGDELSSYHMIAQAGRDRLFGYAQTEDQAREAIAYWTDALRQAGVLPVGASYADGMYQIQYRTADGRVIRDFLADPRQFPPKDEAGLRANMALVRAALEKAGHGVVAARVVSVDALLPTYSVLYLTKPDANPDHEARLRVLKPGDDIDVSVYKGAGVDVVQTPEPWMMVYLGPEVGYVTVIGKTRDEVLEKLAKREDFLKGEGKVLIAHKIEPMDDADYKFAAAIYFFQ
ncbi:MAG: hypothetical protein HY079_14445 [Elusimicrobia bacterium]|nr:hypothetical protein [Elusimicrobiota bacterium]